MLAVPIGALQNTGPATPSINSAASWATQMAGRRSPTARSVSAADSLSCTRASAANSGATVAIPSGIRSCPRRLITATCSWVGNNTSGRSRSSTSSVACHHPSGSGP